MRDLSGQTFGSYRLEGLLGRGGMGEVYRAQHLRLTGRLAAVKILPASFASDPDFLRRFDQEANSAASLDHPNILPVWDYGEQDGTPYLAMPLVPAGSLKELLERRGPISPTEAERYLAPIAEALDYAHSRGILHRDVKPANILLREDGRPQLADFGIAKAIEAGQTQGLTQAGRGIGTPEYMAPEQIEGRAEPRSDIYGLGIVLYQMLSGQLPYDGSTPYEVALKQISNPLPSLRRLRPDISPAVEAVVMRALAKDPAMRYPNGRAFAAAFHEAIVAPKTVPAPVPGIYDQRTRQLPVPPASGAPRGGGGGKAPPETAFVPPPVAPIPQTTARRNASWPLITAALILAVLIVGVGGAYALRMFGAPPPPTPTRPIVAAPSVDPTLTAVAAINATTVAGINATATTNAAQGATATANAAQATATANAIAAEGATATAAEGAAATARAASSATARAAAAATESANATATAAANATATAQANAAASATARAATPVRTPTAPPPTPTPVPPTNTVPPPTVAPTAAPPRPPSAAPSAAPTQANGAAWGPALAPLSGGKRYTDPANRFSFSVPNSWVQAQNTNDQAIFVPADNSSTFTASLSPVSGTTTLENLNTTVEQQVRGQLGGYAAVSLDRVLIDGHQAYRRVSRGKVQGQNVQVLQLYFIDNAVAHLLTFVTKVEDFERLAATFDGVGGSYRVGP
jgi:serine/threonine protein kinase